MKRLLIFSTVLTVFLTALSACNREDVGPIQDGEKTFGHTSFDRLEMGSGFEVTVQPGAAFSVVAKGDQRNLDDLDLVVRNGTLSAEYRGQKNRKYTTAFTITMPTVRGINFSGGVHATIKGFANLSNLDVELSGGSHGNLEVIAPKTNVVVSGGARVELTRPEVTTGDDSINGVVNQLIIDASGGSKVMAFKYPSNDVNVKASGASHSEITATKSLTAEASGASKIRYRGNPTNVNQSASGGSKIERD